MRQKRILAVHDLSCFGKCSLTVALPVLSAAGVECVCLPTAVLSTHTGGFTGYTCRDLSEDILPIAAHWRREGISFDGVYAGYLGSFAVAEKLGQVLDRLGECELILDPAMADGGRLYQGIAPDMVEGYRRLMRRSTLVTPNMTEAALLCGAEYRESPYDEGYGREIIDRLRALGAADILLTGVDPGEGRVGVAVAEKSGEIRFLYGERIAGDYHGTGDLFTSAVAAALMRGETLLTAAGLAMEFTADAIARSAARGTDRRYGVDFEHALFDFMKNLKMGEER